MSGFGRRGPEGLAGPLGRAGPVGLGGPEEAGRGAGGSCESEEK